MKTLAFAIAFICAASCAFADIEKAAAAKFAEAKAEYAAALSESEKRVAAARAEYEGVCSRIEAARKKLGRLARAKDEISNLAARRDFYASVVSELSAETARSFASAGRAASAAEVAAEIKRQLGALLGEIKNPLAPSECEAARAKSRARVWGKSFRVGGFRYFVGGGTAGFLADGDILYGEEYAREILDFHAGKTSEIPADISFGKLLKSERLSLTFAEKVSKGGVWILPILFLAALSAAVFLGKLARLFALGLRPAPAPASPAEALKFPYREVAEAIDSADGAEAADAAAFAALARANASLKSYLGVLSATAAVAPLLGLLGTVSGIIKTFGDMSVSASHAREISDGIAEALITTEYGLITAIPALIAGAVLARMARGILASAREFAAGRIALKK